MYDDLHYTCSSSRIFAAATQHCRYEGGYVNQLISAVSAHKEVLLDRLRFRFRKCLHGVLLQGVFGDVLHDFHGTLFLPEIGYRPRSEQILFDGRGDLDGSTSTLRTTLLREGRFGFYPDVALSTTLRVLKSCRWICIATSVPLLHATTPVAISCNWTRSSSRTGQLIATSSFSPGSKGP